MSTKNVLIGVLAGVATGAAIGLLFAPHKGKSTRKRIMNKGEGYIANFEEIMNGYVDTINKKMENMKVEITAMSSNGKAKAEDNIADLINAKIK